MPWSGSYTAQVVDRGDGCARYDVHPPMVQTNHPLMENLEVRRGPAKPRSLRLSEVRLVVDREADKSPRDQAAVDHEVQAPAVDLAGPYTLEKIRGLVLDAACLPPTAFEFSGPSVAHVATGACGEPVAASIRERSGQRLGGGISPSCVAFDEDSDLVDGSRPGRSSFRAQGQGDGGQTGSPSRCLLRRSLSPSRDPRMTRPGKWVDCSLHRSSFQIHLLRLGLGP